MCIRDSITPWDAAYHLQQHAEDLMLIEDIEKAVKDHIIASFTDRQTGKFQQAELDRAIRAMTDHSARNTKNLLASLSKYLSKAGIPHKPQQDLVKDVFAGFIGTQETTVRFDDLNLNQYIELFLGSDRWTDYGQMFMLDAANLRNLLDDVRNIRNQLAHFRDEIDEVQRELLRFCRDLFDRHPIPEFLPAEPPSAPLLSEVSGNSFRPADDELQPGESRYARLALFLQSQPESQDRVEFTFEQIEGILDGPLPPSARQHRSWWGNDSVGHVQSQQWLDAGWRVARISLTDARVTFARAEDRSQQYIRFFSALIQNLRQQNAFAIRDVSPTGASWITLANLPRNSTRHPLSLAVAFTRGRRFRIELYIDTGDGDLNTRIYNQFKSHRTDIERKMGEPLAWEELTSKRASRIALYAEGSIDDTEDVLAALREWAVDRLIRFEQAINAYAEAALR